MYPPDLEELIEAALVDGELTEKEKQILFKKATTLGIDLDEFEMVLNARLYEKQHGVKSTSDVPPPPPKSNKYGDVKKCPNCGAILQSYQEKCTDCGIEFRNAEANQSVKSFTEQLSNIDAEISKKFAGKYKRMTSEREGKKRNEIFKKQTEVIKHFPIPSTKEDVLELLFFIAPKAQEKFGKEQVVWATKYNEILMKSKIVFSKDHDMIAKIKKYEKKKPSSFTLFISRLNSSYSLLNEGAKGLVWLFSPVFIAVLIPIFIVVGLISIFE